jgi:hypothetical protein
MNENTCSFVLLRDSFHVMLKNKLGMLTSNFDI